MDVTRRNFLLGGGMAVGGLVATSALPAMADDDPSLFPGRGRFERLSLTYHAIAAGATKPFTVLHISDTHLTAAYPDEGEFELDILRARGRLETEPVFAVGVDFGEFRLALRAGRALPAVGSRRDEGPLGVRGGAEEARRGEGEEEMFHHRRVISFPKDNENDYFCTN